MRRQAFGEQVMKARPGGSIRAFCEPDTTTSTPHASVSSGSAPSPLIASTTSAAEVLATTFAYPWMSWTTPVEVSQSVANTTLIVGFAFRACSIWAGVGTVPHEIGRAHV